MGEWLSHEAFNLVIASSNLVRIPNLCLYPCKADDSLVFQTETRKAGVLIRFEPGDALTGVGVRSSQSPPHDGEPSSMVEPQDVTLVDAGSSPAVHPNGIEPTQGQSSNGKTADSRPADRRSNRRWPAMPREKGKPCRNAGLPLNQQFLLRNSHISGGPSAYAPYSQVQSRSG